MIHVTLKCPSCHGMVATDQLESAEKVECPCGWTDSIDPTAIDAGRIVRCPVCKTEDLYVQKDFPEGLGILIVSAGVVLATVAWFYDSWFGTIGVLVSFFAVDALLFHTRANVTVCYRCLAQFRRATENPAHRAFDLAIGERYRQERLRMHADGLPAVADQVGEPGSAERPSR